MGFFSNKAHGVVLIDANSCSVGGGYMVHKKGEVPVLCYSARVPLDIRPEESLDDALLRALDTLAHALITQGAAQLHRELGSAHIQTIVASVSAPWQETSVRTVSIVEKFSFVFTRALMEKAARATTPPPGKVIGDTSVISTTLNGYKMDKPWGKRAERADLTVLTSTIDKAMLSRVRSSLRSAFHSHPIEYTAFAPVAYAVITNLYPLQSDFIALDIGGSSSSAILVKNGVIAAVQTLPQGTNDLLQAGKKAAQKQGTAKDDSFGPRVAEAEQQWLTGLRGLFSALASENPLPRCVFLLADADARDYLKNLIDQSSLRTLWLSDDPLSVIPLSPEHTAAKVRTRGLAEADVHLAFLALFYEHTLARD